MGGGEPSVEDGGLGGSAGAPAFGRMAELSFG
jgi:hypothetical protein